MRKPFGRAAVAFATSVALVTAGALGAYGYWTGTNPTNSKVQWEADHEALAREAAQESMILLNNSGGALPIAASGNIALFGPGAQRSYATGTGSSAMTGIRYPSGNPQTESAGFQSWTVENAFNRMGYQVVTQTGARSNFPSGSAAANTYGGIHTFAAPSNYSNADIALTEALVTPTSPTDTAVYVLLRNAGETYDRVKALSWDLSAKELANLRLIGQNYKHTVVVMWVPGQTDTSFFDTINTSVVDPDGGLALDALVEAGIPGQEGAEALIDLLRGDANFSGKTADTWASDYSYYPAAATFGINDGDAYDETYSEGLYVGYRYFDSFYKTINPTNPEKVVNYPFGFGLSYTTFSIDPGAVSTNIGQTVVKARVTNTGATYSGKEVVQVYASLPQTGLDKPYQQLVGYVKTKSLAPGESQDVRIVFDTQNLASYDPAKAAYVLEAGDYVIRVGNSSRSTHVASVIKVAQTTIVEQLANQMNDIPVVELTSDPANFYSYPTEAAEIAAAPRLTLRTLGFTAPNNASPTAVKTVTLPDDNPLTISHGNKIAPETVYLPVGQTDWEGTGSVYPLRPGETQVNVTPAPAGSTLFDVYKGTITMEQFVASMTVQQMANLATAGGASGTVAYSRGAAGYLRANENLGIPTMSFNDGPSGLNQSGSFNLSGTTKYQRVVAYPSGTNMAQTWNIPLQEAVGKAMGEEMADSAVTMWLAPGANIHRDPLCGRNVEYYSEDPLLSGLSGAASVRGIQSIPGVAATPKHFAVNNQEAEREGNDNSVSERTLREIYLRSFELIVKASQPMAFMSSYNKINGRYTAADYQLLTDLLRNEWGFTGLVMTDWGGNRAGVMNLMYAGNNVLSPGGNGGLYAIPAMTVPTQPNFGTNGLPGVAQSEAYGASPAYQCYFLQMGSIVLKTGAPVVRTNTVTSATAAASTTAWNSANTTINNWVAAAERADQFSGAPRNSIELVRIDETSFEIRYHGIEGTPLRLGDLQRNTMGTLQVAMQTDAFGQLAELRGITDVTIKPYTQAHADDMVSQYVVTSDPAAATDVTALRALVGVLALFEAVPSRYTVASFTPFAEAMADARVALADPAPEVSTVHWLTTQLPLLAKALVESVDVSPLVELLAEAQAILDAPAGYQSAGIAQLTTAVAAAQAVLAGSPTQLDVTAAAIALAESLAKVLPLGDKTSLIALIVVVESLNASQFTPSTWASVNTALIAGRIVRDDAQASRYAVDDAYQALSEALNQLVLRAAKAGLASAINLAQSILASQALYVPASLVGLADALTAAQVVYADDNATTAQVTTAQSALITKIATARLRPVAGSPAGGAAVLPAALAAKAAIVSPANVVAAASSSTVVDQSLAKPLIKGKAKVGKKLRLVKGKPVGAKVRWLRSGKAIRGATKASYKVTKADRGKRISVRVTIGGDVVKSAKTKKVKG